MNFKDFLQIKNYKDTLPEDEGPDKGPAAVVKEGEPNPVVQSATDVNRAADSRKKQEKEAGETTAGLLRAPTDAEKDASGAAPAEASSASPGGQASGSLPENQERLKAWVDSIDRAKDALGGQPALGAFGDATAQARGDGGVMPMGPMD
jgi:hypothetical protein